MKPHFIQTFFQTIGVPPPNSRTLHMCWWVCLVLICFFGFIPIWAIMWVCSNLVSDRALLSAQAHIIETQSEDFKGKFSVNTLSASFNWPYLHNLLRVFLSQAASICLSNFRAFESLWRWSTILINNDPSFCIFLKGFDIAISIGIVEFGGNLRNKSVWNHTIIARF